MPVGRARLVDLGRHGEAPPRSGPLGGQGGDAPPAADRARWTAFVAREAERHGFAWAYWEFASGFGIYDPGAKVWREDLLKALIP